MLNRFTSAAAQALSRSIAAKDGVLPPQTVGMIVAKLEPTELCELWGSDANVPGHMKRQRLQLWGGHLEPASNHAAYDVELSARLRWPMDRLREIGKARGAVAARCDCEVGNSAARQAMTHRAASRIETAMPMRRRCRTKSAPERAPMMTSPTTSHMISFSSRSVP